MRALQTGCYFTDFTVFSIKYFAQKEKKNPQLDFIAVNILPCWGLLLSG